MLRILLARLKQGHRTIPYPARVPVLPDRFRGLPVVDTSKCPEECRSCAQACPTEAITIDGGRFGLDLGRCLFCTECMQACPEGAIQYSQEYRLAVRKREDLVYDGRTLKQAESLEKTTRRLFGRALKLRQVSAGGARGSAAPPTTLPPRGVSP